MEHIRRFQDDRSIFHGRCIGFLHLILVVEVTFIVTVYAHSIGHQRIESDDFTLAISDNLRIGISVKEQVCHQGLSEDKGGHFRIWLIMYQAIQRMLDCFFLAAGVGVLINMNRQASNRLGKNSDASVDGSHLHGTSLIHRFTGITATKQEAVSAAVSAVGGLVS